MNVNDLSVKTIKHLAVGAGVTVLVTFAAALMGFGNTSNIHEWLRTLGIAESGAVGSFIVNNFTGFITPAPTAVSTTVSAPKEGE